jgi:hypothetical protein
VRDLLFCGSELFWTSGATEVGDWNCMDFEIKFRKKIYVKCLLGKKSFG